jgi:predicted nucleic acid-binding protein
LLLEILKQIEQASQTVLERFEVVPHVDYLDALRYVCARKIDAEAILSNDQRFVSPDVAVWRR